MESAAVRCKNCHNTGRCPDCNGVGSHPPLANAPPTARRSCKTCHSSGSCRQCDAARNQLTVRKKR